MTSTIDEDARQELVAALDDASAELATALNPLNAQLNDETAEERQQHKHDRGRAERDHPGPDRAELGELGPQQPGQPVTVPCR